MQRLLRPLALLLGLFTTFAATAQVQVGVRGGATWSTVSKPEFFGNFTPTLRLSPGPTGALFVDVPLSANISFRPELAYIQKGFLFQEGRTFDVFGIPLPVGARIAYQSNQIQVPLLLKASLSDGPVQPYVFAGPAISYAVDGRLRSRATGLLRTQAFDMDLNYGGTLQPWDFSAVGGLGVAFNAGPGKFFAEGRYEHGFTRQIDVPVLQLPVRNRGVSVSLGYSFPIGQ